jgi:hypothetical protein
LAQSPEEAKAFRGNLFIRQDAKNEPKMSLNNLQIEHGVMKTEICQVNPDSIENVK